MHKLLRRGLWVLLACLALSVFPLSRDAGLFPCSYPAPYAISHSWNSGPVPDDKIRSFPPLCLHVQGAPANLV